MGGGRGAGQETVGRGRNIGHERGVRGRHGRKEGWMKGGGVVGRKVSRGVTSCYEGPGRQVRRTSSL